MKLVKSSKKALAILLAFLVCISVIPLSGAAISVNDTVEYTPETQVFSIEEEIIEKRNEYSKTYKLNDGTYYEVISMSPIHENINGEWIEPQVKTETPSISDEVVSYCSELSENLSQNDNGVSIASFVETDNSPNDIQYRYLGANSAEMISPNSSLLIEVPIAQSNSAIKKEVTVEYKISFVTSIISSGKLCAHAIEEPWTLTQELDSSSFDISNNIEDYCNVNGSGTYTFDITNLYMQWEQGKRANYGFAIKSLGQIYAFVNGYTQIRRYRLIDGFDSNFTHHSIDMGRAGTLHVNDFTNSIFLERKELGFESNILPIELYRYFDFSKPYSFCNAIGEGGRWNYTSTLYVQNSSMLTWDLFDGSSTTFIKHDTVTEEETGNDIITWLDTNGDYVLTSVRYTDENYNDVKLERCKITSSDGMIYNFNSHGNVILIKDQYNNNIEIAYMDSSPNLINYIKDGLGRKYCFIYSDMMYNENGTNHLITTLQAIKVIDKNNNFIKLGDEAPLEITYADKPTETVNIAYTYCILPNNHIALTKVLYPDNQTVEYHYNDYGYLSEIIDIDGRRLTINYDELEMLSLDGNTTTSTLPYVTSLIEEVINIDDDPTSPDYQEYLVKSSLTIDRTKSYQREFEEHTGKTELIHYSTNLDMLYYQDSLGEAFYADYAKDANNLYYLSQILAHEQATNILQNSDFESDLTGTWVDINSGSLSRGNNIFGDHNNHHLVVSANTVDTRIIAQNVPLDGKANDVYVVGSKAYANAPIPNEDHFVGIEVYPLTEVFTGIYVVPDNAEAIYKLAFDPTIDNDTQFRIGAFKLEEDVKGLQFRLVYAMQNGEAYFDDTLLYKSVTGDVSFFNPNNTTDDIETSTNPAETIITQNEKGLITSETSSDGNNSMISQYTYDSDYFNASWTDNNNVTTNYVYDSDTGTLSQKGVGNNITTYKYTPIGALKEVSTAVSGLTDNISNIKTTYTYSGDRIESIVHNDTTFQLNYNSFGNVKSVQINPNNSNDSNLISYDYSTDYKQELNSIEYANGDKLFYTYNENTGNVESISSNDESSTNPDATKLLYEYNYDSNGDIVQITDYDSKRIIEYTETGHTIKEFTVSDTQELIIGRTISTFAINNSGNKVVTLFGNEFTTQTDEAIYNENSKETSYATQCHFDITEGPVTFKSQSVSDYFGRIKYSQISVSMDNEPESTHNIKNTYTYKNYSAPINDETVTGTTNLIQSCTSEVFTAQSGNTQDILASLTTSYQYDNSGRITHIFYNQDSEEILATYYRYDAAGQLILEFDNLKEFLTEYAYDSHGNLTSKTVYQKDQIVFDYNKGTYTIKENEEPQIITYSYGNSSNSGLVYSDVLTSVSDNSVPDETINISYDNNGNPLNLFTKMGNDITPYTLEWNGTLLNSITNIDSGVKCDYSYDNNGIRTKKTLYEIDDNNTVTSNKLREINYIWDDDLLVGSEITTYKKITDPNNGTTSNVVNNTIFTKTLYDEYDNPIGVYYKSDLPEEDDDSSTINVLPHESVFWFIKDGQGNVKALITDSDDYALGCSYDAYGNITLNLEADFLDEIKDRISASDSILEQVLLGFVASIAAAASVESALSIGSSTYRGYIFDTESGLLYCQNRYYSPTIGRFINMDDPAQLTENLEEPLNSNLYAYCGNDPINNIDPLGRSKYTLSAVGMQAEMSASLLSFAGAVGIELVYVWSKNAVYAYYYYGGGAGVGYTNSAINYLKNSLKSISMSPKVSLKNIANMFKLNWSITIGFFAAFTDKKFSWPNSYVGNSKSTAVSIGKAKGYKATGTGCNVYGICYSVAGNSGFAVSTTTAKYKKITFNASAIKSYLSSQKNTIKKAVE